MKRLARADTIERSIQILMAEIRDFRAKHPTMEDLHDSLKMYHDSKAPDEWLANATTRLRTLMNLRREEG